MFQYLLIYFQYHLIYSQSLACSDQKQFTHIYNRTKFSDQPESLLLNTSDAIFRLQIPRTCFCSKIVVSLGLEYGPVFLYKILIHFAARAKLVKFSAGLKQ